MAAKLTKKVYERELERLQLELIDLQDVVREKGLRVAVLMEGRDAAGKGGIIKRITEHLNPRAYRVVALGVPTERERGQWYFQRYVERLPAAGEICLFDRSWYNRAGVERVMGFCTEEDVLEFFRETPALERMLVGSGLILRKYWLEVSAAAFRRSASASVPRTPPSGGSSAPSTSRRARSTTTTRRPATTCSATRTPPTRRGTWWTPRTSGAPASTASPTCSSRSRTGSRSGRRPRSRS